jgi:hypothetical protein
MKMSGTQGGAPRKVLLFSGHMIDAPGREEPRFSPAHFGKLIGDETEKWVKVIRAAGIKAE